MLSAFVILLGLVVTVIGEWFKLKTKKKEGEEACRETLIARVWICGDGNDLNPALLVLSSALLYEYSMIYDVLAGLEGVDG
jgi:hypothetical protein